MSKHTDRIVRDLSQCSFRELLIVAQQLHTELGEAATSILLSVLSQSGGLPTTLILEDAGEKRMALIKKIREHWPALHLQLAKALTEGLPQKLPKTNNPAAVAADLRLAGASIKLVRE
jgi:ribosomal protein L7/L12